ncbi:MAG: SpoIIE family protein phosphatase, partial [Clostridiales bacterium]|nr:SpoIIE family protein phosphatase [Clostridiales bacterium]
LEGASKAFKELHENMRGAFYHLPANDGDVAVVFDRAAERVCRGCALRDSCWQRNYVTTFNALNDAAPAMLERGRGVGSDFPSHFTGRCLHFPAFLAAANEELTALLCRSQYQRRLRESRLAVCRQYAEVGRILGEAAIELSAELVPDAGRERKVKRHLTALGLEGTVAAYYDEHGHLRIETPNLAVLRSEGERKKLSALVGMPLRPAEKLEDRLVFTQAEPLMAVVGLAARCKEGETVSGDAGLCFRRNDGGIYLLLCDGMGSGPAAGEESRRAVKVLEDFLQAGVEPVAALRTLNAALALRGEEEGGFTTIDLLEVDLFTGEGAVYKFGAAPTYVRKGPMVSRVSGSAFPAGLTTGDSVTPDMARLSLAAGDWVVLVSDGITSGEEDGWVRELIASFDGDSPKELARVLVQGSEGKQCANDDCTAMAVRLVQRREETGDGLSAPPEEA